MMRMDVLTIFPAMFESPFGESIVKRAVDGGALTLHTHDIREYADDKHRTTDDYPFGGGAGMVMKPGPVVRAAESVYDGHHRILLTPSGKRADQRVVERLAAMDKLMFICGRYEGVDRRVSELVVDEELSVGDFVISGGEIAAMALIDAVTRLLPGVLGNSDSAADESFSADMLEYPQYTRPRVFRGLEVPEVLVSGNHGAIEEWRREKAREMTLHYRPDLVNGGPVYTALVHYPVVDKHGDRVSTSITPIDIHDIARTCRTYNVKNYFLVSPNPRQNSFVMDMLGFWNGGAGKDYNSNRSEALASVRLVETIEEAREVISEREGDEPEIWVTSARYDVSCISYEKARERLRSQPEKPVLILFGTGWGLDESVLEKACVRLAPVKAAGNGFNHLSVRSAAAIMLDRLLGNGR